MNNLNYVYNVFTCLGKNLSRINLNILTIWVYCVLKRPRTLGTHTLFLTRVNNNQDDNDDNDDDDDDSDIDNTHFMRLIICSIRWMAVRRLSTLLGSYSENINNSCGNMSRIKSSNSMENCLLHDKLNCFVPLSRYCVVLRTWTNF